MHFQLQHSTNSTSPHFSLHLLKVVICYLAFLQVPCHELFHCLFIFTLLCPFPLLLSRLWGLFYRKNSLFYQFLCHLTNIYPFRNSLFLLTEDFEVRCNSQEFLEVSKFWGPNFIVNLKRLVNTVLLTF